MASKGWTASDSKDNALATATRPANANDRHSISSVVGSYSASISTPRLLQVKDGVTVVWSYYLPANVSAIAFDFDPPFPCTPGNAVSAVLDASGTGGQVGIVGLVGITSGV